MKSGSALKAVVVFALALLSGCRRQESASEKLLALAPHSARPIEARLSGFEWPEARVQRGTPNNLLDPSRLELAGAASAVIQSFANNPSAHARHEAGAAYLLIDRDRDAIDALESAVRQSPKEAAYWSDLSAARYTLAVREKRPHELPQALADADHALRIKPTLHDALFNRALIIEALGITEAARRAWQRYVAADPSSHWAAEAMHHLGNLRVVTTRDEFQNRLALASCAFHAGNDALLVALARNFPQEARTWSEGPLLAKWADAFRKGDAKNAAETLSVVRKLGAALAEFNHVYSVTDVIAAIDRADAEHVQILADAHAVYRDARVLYSQRRVVAAQEGFRRAESLFVRGGSPMALITDYYLASCLYDSNRPLEANIALAQIAARVDAKRYPALLAEIQWEQNLCYASAGDWETAIRTASNSRKIFSDLGEDQNRATVDLLLATDLNYASQPAAAWKARVAAYPVLSRAGSLDRVRNSLLSAINAERAQGRFEVAHALATIAVDEIRHSKEPTGESIAESARARSLASLGWPAEAQRAIARARRSADTVPDRALHDRTSAAVNMAEAVVLRKTRPADSIRLLDAAASFYRLRHGQAWLPEVYLERGRTHAWVKDDDAALNDFEAGLHEINAQRATIADKELRDTFYDTEPELFSETIALLLRRAATERAFALSDVARGRSLFERSGINTKVPAIDLTAAEIRNALPPRTSLIEYSLLPDAIAIFYFSSTGSGVVRVPATPMDVRALVERCNDLLQHRADPAKVRSAVVSLHRLLIEPIAAQIAGSEALVFVPDRQLHTVPFAALYDTARGRYLVEDVAISVAPSAASAIQRRHAGNLEPVLVVADPHDEGGVPLPNAAREAAAVAAMYDSSTLLAGDRATAARFITAARHSGMIHYAGHAESDSRSPFGALHLATDDRNGDLDATAIAGLQLTNSPLVVLAACGTIRGDSEHIEGMPSIARAFLVAGARGVIGTLWEVDDDIVAPLFRRFHQELRQGVDAATALRRAQVAMARHADPRVSHPSSWSPIELLGYSDSIASVRKGSK